MSIATTKTVCKRAFPENRAEDLDSLFPRLAQRNGGDWRRARGGELLSAPCFTSLTDIATRGLCFALLLIPLSGAGFGQETSVLPDVGGPVAIERVREMIECGHPGAIPILRHWFIADSHRVTIQNMSSSVFVALDGLGRFGDRHLLDEITTLYENRNCAPLVRDAAAMAIARIGSEKDRELLKQIVWDPRLSAQPRCESAVTLLELDVPEAAEFLLLQYDLYRLERRMVDRWNMGPARSALQRVNNKQILAALDERLKDEPDAKMRNNIRTLKERMKLNGLALDQVRRIAANPDCETGRYQRYPAIMILGERGALDTIAFLETLKPWETDNESFAKQVKVNNDIILPNAVKEATGMIRQRHHELVSQRRELLPHLTTAERDAVRTTAKQEKPSFEELVRRLKSPNFGDRYQTLGYVGSMKPSPEKIAPHVIRLLQDPHFNIRSSAANALGNLQNSLPDIGTRFPECIAQLIRMLSDRDEQDIHHKVPRYAAYALRHLGKVSQPAVPALLEIARNKSEPVALRTEAVSAFGYIGDASPEVVDTLVELLDDTSRINENYATIASTASYSLARLGAEAKSTQDALLLRLRHATPGYRKDAARALGTVGFGSLEVEEALLDLLDDSDTAVQKTALSSLEKINDTYTFLFHHRVSSREVSERRRILMDEIRSDSARKSRFARVLAAQLRLGEGQQRNRALAVSRLFELDAREHLPLIRQEFGRLEKKALFAEHADLRMQLLLTLAAWLPEQDVVSFLIAVDSDLEEDLRVRFRAAVLLCELGDDALANAYLSKRHFPDSLETKPLATTDALQKSLRDRRRYASDEEFKSLKLVTSQEVARIQQGLQLAQHLFLRQEQGEITGLYVSEVFVEQGHVDRIRCGLAAPSTLWTFELRKKNGRWLPCDFSLEYIE